METPNRLLKLTIIAIAITLIGWFCQGEKAGANEETDVFSFVDGSNGLPSTGQWRHGMGIYDINGDGYLDIAAPPPRKAEKGHDRPFVWYGNGKDKWAVSHPDVPSDSVYDYGDMAVADFDGDGIADMALAMHGKGLKVLRGKGSNKYVDFSVGLPSKQEFMSRAIVSADFNNDNIPDIAAVSEAKFPQEGFPLPSGVRICFQENGKWTCKRAGGEIESRGLFADQLTVGDVNGDGNKDIAVASLEHERDLIIWIGDGKGGFSPFNQGLPTEMHYLSVSLCDINGDGRDDLVASVSGFGSQAFIGLKAFLSGPDGFKEASEGLPTEGFTALGCCDLNGDGVMEIVGATATGGVKILSWKGARWDNVRVSGLPEKGLNRVCNLYLIDMNKDGRKDIVLNQARHADNSGGIRVFLNVPPK